MGPMASDNYPNFNVLGLLLGGRGYATNWFANREKLQMMEQQEQQQRQAAGAFAQDFLNSPQFAQSIANPYDRKAAFGAWGQTQAGPELMRGLGNDLIKQQLDAIYAREGRVQAGDINKEQLRLGADLTKQDRLLSDSLEKERMEISQGYTRSNTLFSDQLERERIKLDADQQLFVDQKKRERDKAAEDALWSDFLAPDPEGSGQAQGLVDARRTAQAKKLGLNIPEGYKFQSRNGIPQIVMDPMTPTGQEHYALMQDTSALIEDAEMILKHHTGEQPLERGVYNNLRADIIGLSRKLDKTGTLDEGTLKFFNEQLPSFGMVGANSLTGVEQEQLRTIIAIRKRDLMNIQARTQLPLQATGRLYGDQGGKGPPASLVEKRNALEDKIKQRAKDRFNTDDESMYRQPDAPSPLTGR